MKFKQVKDLVKQLEVEASDYEIGSHLQKLADQYLNKNELSKVKINDSTVMEFEDVGAIVEHNVDRAGKRAVLAILQDLEGYLRVASHSGPNKNMIIFSGTMDSGIVFNYVKTVLNGFKSDRIEADNIDIFLPYGNGYTNKMRNLLYKVYQK